MRARVCHLPTVARSALVRAVRGTTAGAGVAGRSSRDSFKLSALYRGECVFVPAGELTLDVTTVRRASSTPRL